MFDPSKAIKKIIGPNTNVLNFNNRVTTDWIQLDKSYSLKDFPKGTLYFRKDFKILYIINLKKAFPKRKKFNNLYMVGYLELNANKTNTSLDKGFSNKEKAMQYLISLMKKIKDSKKTKLKRIYTRDSNLEIAMVKAVEHHEKPIATINKKLEKQLGFKSNLPYLIIDYYKKSDPEKIYYRPDTKNVALEFKRLVDYQHNPNNPRPFSKEYHRKIGKLLGYPRVIIEEFVKKQR